MKILKKTWQVTRHFFSMLLLSFVLSSCATVGKPEGGPTDVSPPLMKNSMPNDSATGFNGNEIIMEFDEFISVKNATQNVIINPAMKKIPVVVVRGKRVIVKLPERPKENTTYAIDFGNSIIDITAGNILKNYHFVFSTNNYIDTCQLSGNVIMAQTAKPAGNIWVFLHQNQDDISDTIPPYKVKTDEDGRFSLPFLPKGKFFLYALDDPDADLKYKAYSEKIAFCDSLVVFDSLHSKFKTSLWLFQETDTINKLLRFQRSGKNSALASFRSPVGNVIPEFNVSGTLFRFNPGRDTLNVWFPSSISDSLTLKMNDGKTAMYSAIPLKEKENKGKANSDTILALKTNLADNFLISGDTLTISSKQPFFVNQADSIQLLSDGREVSFKLLRKDSLSLNYNLIFQIVPNKDYKLRLGKNAFEDFSKNKNQGTEQTFRMSSENDLGSVTVSFNKAFPVDAIVIISGKTIERKYILPSSRMAFTLEKLPAGEYTARCIPDSNNDGRWTNGNLSKRLLPEKNYVFPGVIKIRKGFETKTEWRISD